MSAGSGQRAPVAVGVVVPVHDEEDLLPAALEGVEEAVDALPLSTSCRVAVVLDDCRDGSSAVARAWARRVRALVIERECRSVGSARRAGTQALLSILARGACRPRSGWRPPMPTRGCRRTGSPFSSSAYGSGSDLWAGQGQRRRGECRCGACWKETYAAERQPIHGASMGFSAFLYQRIGGFRPLRTGEDRDFHRRAVAAGFRVTYDLQAAVTTSARRKGRAPGVLRGRVGGRRGRTARSECLNRREFRLAAVPERSEKAELVVGTL